MGEEPNDNSNNSNSNSKLEVFEQQLEHVSDSRYIYIYKGTIMTTSTSITPFSGASSAVSRNPSYSPTLENGMTGTSGLNDVDGVNYFDMDHDEDDNTSVIDSNGDESNSCRSTSSLKSVKG